MDSRKILKQYIEKKKEYHELLSNYGIIKFSSIDPNELKELNEKTSKAEREMLDITRIFIEGFII